MSNLYSNLRKTPVHGPIEEECQIPQNVEKSKLFLEIVETVKSQNTKAISLDPFKQTLNLPMENLPEVDQILIIYEKLMKKNKQSKKNWSFHENQLLVWLVLNYCLIKEINPLSIPEKEMKEILSIFPGKSFEQTKFKWFSLRKCHLYSTPWTKEEDEILKRLIIEKGSNKWNEISKEMNKLSGSNVFRLGKQCRERWNNHLDPTLNRGPWTKEEDLILLNTIMDIGKKWSDIAKRLVGRTENSVKNRFISLMNKEKSLLSLEEESNNLPNDESIDSQTSDDIEENALIKSLIFTMEKESGDMKSSKSLKVKVKKNILMDLINQEKKSKEEECSSSQNSTINNLKIFTPNIDKSHNQDNLNLESLLGKTSLYGCLNDSNFLKTTNKTPFSNMNTPGASFEPTKINSNQSMNLQEILKKDFSNFFLGNQNPLVTLVHGIQLIRFSLFVFQKESNKLPETPTNSTNQDKKIVNVKDFNSLLSENNFQDLQLSFFNPLKNDVFLLNPMSEIELSQMEMNVETQNVLINMNKLNLNLTNSNFLSMPQNFSPFNMNHLISPNFTPIINRANFNPAASNLMNSNNLLGFNNINSNFSSPAINFNLFSNMSNNDFLLNRFLENMNGNNKTIDKIGINSNINNNMNNNMNNIMNNNNMNIKMEDEENNLLKKRLKD